MVTVQKGSLPASCLKILNQTIALQVEHFATTAAINVGLVICQYPSSSKFVTIAINNFYRIAPGCFGTGR